MARIEIDEGSGFCFGVTTAIKKAEEELAKGGILYCLGDIVHNSREVERLKEMGLITINHEEFNQLQNAKVLLRAHGEPPETYAIAQRNNIEIIDATCPVVLRLQKRIKQEYDLPQVGEEKARRESVGRQRRLKPIAKGDGSQLFLGEPFLVGGHRVVDAHVVVEFYAVVAEAKPAVVGGELCCLSVLACQRTVKPKPCTVAAVNDMKIGVSNVLYFNGDLILTVDQCLCCIGGLIIF